jgi:opacity protein-like surface antigen
MKKLKTVFAAVAILLATSAFAASGPEKVTQKVKTAFESHFAGASNVNWEKNDDFYFASFTLNSGDVSAAYNENGDLVGVARLLTSTQLPLNVTLAIADKYKGYDVSTTVTELIYDGETSYRLTVVNDKQIVKLKCSSDGDITVTGKIRK